MTADDQNLLAAHALHLKLARQAPSAFMSYVLRDERTNEKLEQAPIHKAWQKLISKHRRLLIWSAVESGKSSQISVGRTLFELGRNPNLRCAIVSNTQNQAAKIGGVIAKYIEGSEDLHEVFPDLKPGEPWTSSQLFVRRGTYAKDPSVQVCGIHGNITGSRLDLLILDDVLDFENCRTENLRQELWDWYHATLVGRLTADAKVVVVGTAFHPRDVLHRLAQSGGWSAYRYPVIDPETGEPRWPEKWPEARIEAKRIELGPLEFARQMMCVARDDAESRFKKEWIDLCLARGADKEPTPSLPEIPPGCKTVTGVDLAVSKKSRSGETVLFTILVHPNGDREVLWIDAGKFSGPEIVSKIVDTHRRFGSTMYVENNACFPPYARVLTKAGYRQIAEVQPGEIVLTHLGRWRKVLQATRRNFSGELVTVQSSGGLPVSATPKHAFWCKRSGRVLGPRKGVDTGKFRPVGDPGWVSACLLRSPLDNSGYGSYYLRSPLPQWDSTTAKVTVMKHEVSRAVEIDRDAALFMGLFLADGCVSKQNSQVSFHLGETKKHFFEGFLRRVACQTFRGSLRVTPCKGQRSWVGVVNSVEAKCAVAGWGKEESKRLPWEYMGWPLDVRLAIVRGWLLGDGCLRRNNENTSTPGWTFSGSTISRNLALQMKTILVEAGFRPSLSVHKPRNSKIGNRIILSRHPLFQVALNTTDTLSLLRLANTREERLRWKSTRLRTRKRFRNSSCAVLDDGGMWQKVRKTRTEKYDGPVYNLVVEEDASYVVEDVAVHNSQEYLLQFARSESAVPVMPFTTGKNKANPEFGIESIAVEMSNGKWIIPCKDNHIHKQVSLWIQEMLYYSPSAHSGDRLMASWFAREGIGRAKKKAWAGRIDMLSR